MPRHRATRCLPARSIAFVPLLLASAWQVPEASARTTVFRCSSAEGVSTYSDQPCESFGARQVQPPLEAADSGRLRAADEIPQAYPGERRLDAMCPARTLAELPTAIGRAFALEDVNAIASLYHWPGLTQGDAGRMFGRFRSLLAQPLQNVGVGSAGGMLQASDGAPALGGNGSSSASQQVWLSVGPEQAPQVVRFDVVRNAGCVWLRFG